jgi:cytoskeletal protein RodZ
MPSIGETLRTARNQKGASEETVAKILKIKVERLKDLEENRFDRFAAPVYVRSFIRNYANYLEIDGLPLVQQYEKDFPEPDRKPIFDVKEDTRAHTFIRHQPPAKAQGLALTSTGQVVLFAAIFLIVAGAIVVGILMQTPPTVSVSEVTPSSETAAPTSSGLIPTTPLTPLENNPTNTPSSVNEPWKVSTPAHLDSALTFSTNAPSTPTSVPGQAVHTP